MITPQKVLAIVGPTAVGKSALALKLASMLGGEIVSADSRQVYRCMDIGTAKPRWEDRVAIPHHLIDVVYPDEMYSLALFLRQTRVATHDIQSRSKLPILVGGTGQYVWGLLEGWQVPDVPPDQELREALEAKVNAEGVAALHHELLTLDPAVAGRVDPCNPRRVIRALEVYYSSPESSRGISRAVPSFNPVVLGLTIDREAIYERINARVEMMIEEGWVAEVERLLDQGYTKNLPSMSSLGYRELAEYLTGRKSLESAVAVIKQRTRRFARQQYAWFRLNDTRIRWIEESLVSLDEVSEVVRELLAGA